MPRFRFEAVDDAGRRLRGVTMGPGVAAVELQLEAQGLLPIRIQEADGGSFLFSPLGLRREVIDATRSISALLSAGLPLPRCLSITADHMGGSVGDAVSDVQVAVEGGRSLAAALDGYPALFSPLYRGLVRAGERSGELPAAFERLLGHLEREEETRGRIVSAMVYPAVLVSFGGLALGVILLWVVPRFAELITESGASLPRTTSLLVGASGVLREHGAGLAVLLIGALAALVALASSAAGRQTLGRVALAVPLAGALRRQILAARFARLLGTLLHGGAPVLAALRDVEESVADPALRIAVAGVWVRVREGKRLSDAVAAAGFFPDLLVRLLGIGEDSARLPAFASKAADILEQRAEQRVRRFVALLEPGAIILFGGLIALVAISLFQAIYGVNAGAF